MDEDELKQLLEEYGPVYQVGIIRDRANGQHRGKFVYVLIAPHVLSIQVSWPLAQLDVIPVFNFPHDKSTLL